MTRFLQNILFFLDISCLIIDKPPLYSDKVYKPFFNFFACLEREIESFCEIHRSSNHIPLVIDLFVLRQPLIFAFSISLYSTCFLTEKRVFLSILSAVWFCFFLFLYWLFSFLFRCCFFFLFQLFYSNASFSFCNHFSLYVNRKIKATILRL